MGSLLPFFGKQLHNLFVFEGESAEINEENFKLELSQIVRNRSLRDSHKERKGSIQSQAGLFVSGRFTCLWQVDRINKMFVVFLRSQ